MPCPALLRVAHDAVARLGESDCEELGDGVLVQPINALTSLSYVVVGMIIVAIAWRRGRPARPAADVSTDSSPMPDSATPCRATIAFAVLLAAVGLGSLAFHGPQPDGSRLMHDAPILLTVFLMLSVDVAQLSAGSRRWWSIFPTAAGVGIVVSLFSPDAGVALTGMTIVAVVACEALIHRRRLRPVDVRPVQRTYALVIGVTAVAAATWLLGRTGSPACDPDGPLQLHGLWHVLSAVVFGAWWWVAIGAGGSAAQRPTSRANSASSISPR